jgi:hypothetical protein
MQRKTNIYFFRDFESARKFVHKQKIKTQREWQEWSKSTKRPDDIPSNPQRTYKNDGWINWTDWLGTNNIATQIQHNNFLLYKKARKFARSLNLKSAQEWRFYWKEIDSVEKRRPV